MIKQIFLTIACFGIVISVNAQGPKVLSKTEAISIVMGNNFDLKIAENDILVAENNTSIYNSGYLPTLTGTAGVTYNSDNLEVQFQDGTNRTLNGATSDSRNAGLNMNYVLFNGFNRKFNMDFNKESLNAAQLTARATLESVLLSLFTAYYNVARNEQTIKTLKETLAISKDRLLRTQYGFDYGRNTKLDVSTAQVDVNTDSINYLNAVQNLGDAQRNLNLILGRETMARIMVDTSLTFTDLSDYETFRQSVLEQNTSLLSAKSGLDLSRIATKTNTSRNLPVLSVNGSYNYRLGNNNSASFLASNISSGVSGGLTLGWNIFDGGAKRTAVQNARITESTFQLQLDQTRQQVIILFENAWTDYQNKKFILEAQRNNLNSNEMNFDRTQEQYRLGQVTSLEFRTAQSNLLNAQNSVINASYEAKLAELLIFQLAGKIQEATF